MNKEKDQKKNFLIALRAVGWSACSFPRPAVFVNAAKGEASASPFILGV
ncbi:MAG: hypothetical protein K2P37_02210 [Oscillospiraceae bacterium]|nr:hypothetical protein [Oscillospiraceae bacterium]